MASSPQLAHELPMMVLMKPYADKMDIIKPYDEKTSFFNDGGPKARAVTMDSEKGVFNPLAKIQVERAKIDSSYVHLKFPHSRKYFAVNWYPGSKSGDLVANSDGTEEDTTKPSCTLFKPVRFSDGSGDDKIYYNLIHVQSGFQVHTDISQCTPRLMVSVFKYYFNQYSFVDWDTIVKLPEYVAFKGDNGRYLQAHWQDTLPYLQFSSDDPYHAASVFRVEPRLDGAVRIKSEHFGKYWRLSPNWIWADEDRQGSFDRLDDVFWPTKINDTTVVLRNAAANRYCARLPDVDGKKDCLNAAVWTTDMTARLGVEELVSERKITEVTYRMDEARIIEEKPHMAGQVTVENRGDHDAAMEVELGFEDEESVNFSHGFSIMAGVAAKLTASVPFIAEGSIEVKTEVTVKFEWGHTTTNRKSLKATGTVTVPARHMAVVHCVGTKGTCDIPFSYRQVDRSSVDETITRTLYHDGFFTGSNSYNFHFIIDRAIPIAC